MIHLLLQTAATTAHAANEAARAWSAEEWRDLVVGVIGALAAAFIAWQNAQLGRQAEEIKAQNIAHEQHAEERSQRRGP